MSSKTSNNRKQMFSSLEPSLRAYYLKNGYKKSEELAYSVTPQLVDDLEAKLRSVWGHNEYRLKNVIEPAIEVLRANLQYK